METEIFKALSELTPFPSMLRQAAQKRRIRIHGERIGARDPHEWRVVAETVGGNGREFAEAVGLGIAVVRTRRRCGIRVDELVRAERHKKFPEVCKTLALVEVGFPGGAIEAKQPGESVKAFLELTGGRFVFGPIRTVDEKLAAARQPAQQRPRTRRARSAFVPPIQL